MYQENGGINLFRGVFFERIFVLEKFLNTQSKEAIALGFKLEQRVVTCLHLKNEKGTSANCELVSCGIFERQEIKLFGFRTLANAC